ncbi:MAG: hypothetical protein HY315_10530 [Acidobacteria bacterium]|nr:hypothetical protein [Acidobacteriota bacterium]
MVKSVLITLLFLAGGFLAWYIRQSYRPPSSVLPGKAPHLRYLLAKLDQAIMKLGNRMPGRAMEEGIAVVAVFDLILAYRWAQGPWWVPFLIVGGFAGVGVLAWKMRQSAVQHRLPVAIRWSGIPAALRGVAGRLRGNLPPHTAEGLIGLLCVYDLALAYIWTGGSIIRTAAVMAIFAVMGLAAWKIREFAPTRPADPAGGAAPGQQSRTATLCIFAGAAVLYSFLSPLWVDQDSLCALGWSIRGATSIFAVYQEWSWGPSFYAPGPVNSWLLLIGHPVFKALGYTFPEAVTEGWGFNPFTLYLYKWIQGVPFVLGSGFLFYRMFGNLAAALFLFNPATLWFIVLAGLFDNMYAVFFVSLGLFFLQRDRMIPFVLAMAFALLSKQTIGLLVPVLILMLLFSKRWKAVLYLALLYAVPAVISHPYNAFDPKAYIAHDDFWVRPGMHYGFTWAQYFFTTPVFAVCWMALLVVKKPRLTLAGFSMWTMPLYLVYTIGAQFAFEKFIYSALPMMLVVTMFLCSEKKKGAVWLFLALTLLPPLSQIWWRTVQSDIRIEPYTNYWNVHTPIRVKLNLRPEINQPGLLISTELGVMLAFMISAGTSLLKREPTFDWKGKAAARGVGKYLAVLCSGIFAAGALYTHSRSADWIKWKEFQITDQIKNSRFEAWVPFPLEQERGDLPDYWRTEGSISSMRRVANTGPGSSQSIMIEAAPDRDGFLTQEFPIQFYCGGIIKVTASVWADKAGTAMLSLSDGAIESSSYHAGSGKFEDVSASFKVENSPLLQGRRKLKLTVGTSAGKAAIFGNVRMSLLTRQTLFPVHRDDPISFVSAF